ncbi:MAG: hypothetical protein C0617_15520 [Desulfuromonas sp.]|uniref:tetratricopeptide repeat protein n=1 Tax=Desulfuromonas sp. TaxID=892 RepID=UPI000CB5E64B|nr:hypothetical protein [Desulfuromonas sp.]PLX81927.1 MAG: hypothetical protein C0617_15520 [Desulfuromonas sp.]
MHENQDVKSLDPQNFVLWTPPKDATVEVGPEQNEVPLPKVPLPVKQEDLSDGEPDSNAIGQGLYDYLRQFPDCEFNTVYAGLLRDAFPHFIADMGAQIVMLEHKEVDAPYVRRKITYMKILSLLDPENPGLLQRLGISFFDVGTMFSELDNCRLDLLKALGYLQRSLKYLPNDPTTLNYLGQIDFFLGDFPGAARRWQGVVDRLEAGPTRDALESRIEQILQQEIPDHPLIDDLEAAGEALKACGEKDFETARQILERLEEEGVFLENFSSPQFFYLLGVCREKGGDLGGAFEAFEKALEIDPDMEKAIKGKDRIIDGGGI